MKHSIIKQKGIGLIEVLITSVVVGVGLLSVASLQGQLMSSSGENKTRSEARVLAEQKIEELRNNIVVEEKDNNTPPNVIGGYNFITARTYIDTGNPIAGTNASFIRSWTITGANAPNRKKISVQVGWDANGDSVITPPAEAVNVVTEMAWIDPAKAAQYAATNGAGGTTAVASPRQNASEDVASEKVIGSTTLDIPSGVTAGTATSIAVTIPATTAYPGGGSATLVQVAPGSHFYTLANNAPVEPGVIAVFLCTTTCLHIQNHFGGVVHRIAGTVHSTSSNGFTHIKVAWTSSTVNDCYNGPVTVVSGTGNNQYRYRPYECVYAGNCDATDNNIDGCTYGVTDDQISARKVGPGGEYGDVGLLGVDDQGGDREQVCLLEDTVNPATSPLLAVSGSNVLNETYLYPVTKRFYAARRIKRNGSINDQKSEGINRSYTNHNFLVVSRGSGASANQVCNLTGIARSVPLAPREIFKTLDESAANTSLAETAYAGAAGTAKTFAGLVTGSATKLKLIIPDQGNCYLNNNTDSSVAATAYACAVPPGTTSVAIKGGSNEYPTLNPAVFASCTKTDVTPCTWIGNFTASATPSNDCTAPWGATVTNLSSVTAYQNATEPFGGTCTPETRTCTTGTFVRHFTNQTCTVAAEANCTAPWGAAVINGSSVNAYAAATVPAGFTCAPITRACTNGILSGSGTFATCAVQTTRDITVTATQAGTGTILGITAALGSTTAGTFSSCSGAKCTVSNDWTGTLTATGTCSGGGSVSGTSSNIIATATSATITLASCTGPVCPLPWGGSIASGPTPVTAYRVSSVLAPSACPGRVSLLQ